MIKTEQDYKLDDENASSTTSHLSTYDLLSTHYPKPARISLYKALGAPSAPTITESTSSQQHQPQRQERSDLMKLLLGEAPDDDLTAINGVDHDSPIRILDDADMGSTAKELLNPTQLLNDFGAAHDGQLKGVHKRISAAAKEIEGAYAKHIGALMGWKEQINQHLDVLQVAYATQRKDIAIQINSLQKFPKPNKTDPTYDIRRYPALHEVFE